MEEGDGQSELTIDAGGVGYWLTPRAPLSRFTPVLLGLGLAHRMGPARVGGRAQILFSPGETGPGENGPGENGPGDDEVAFLWVNFLEIDRVFRSESRIRPYGRGALGFGLDLRGPVASLGGAGYFNDDNGAAAGLALSHGWGVDVQVTDGGLFFRTEADARVYGGAGRVGVVVGLHTGLGLSF